MANKRILVVCHGTYRGVQILESEGKFIIYLGTERFEFNALLGATNFINEWYALKNN
ncbi:MAG: hypothetical protein IPL32_18035 [Chloracidobacterium sp.]|nr:hypothetical protein [Chloracidobacterium sp.]